MDYISAQTETKQKRAAALAAVETRSSAKEYKKASPVRAELRAAVAWAEK
jgi:hypothetical protein